MNKLVSILLFFCVSAFSQNENLFEEANNAYSQANYEEAAAKYEQILQNGEVSAELYYNLGNAYYRLEEIGPSIFYFEKASQLAPNDEDIINNLTIAKNSTTDEIGEYESAGFLSFTNAFTVGLGVNAWEYLAILFAFGFLILFGLYYFSASSKSKKIFFAAASFSVLFAIFSAGVAYFQQQEREENNFAIVFEEVVKVKNEPTQRGNDVFMLHEGAKVKIEETFQEWVEISLPDGKQGWIQQEQVKFL